jgi:hypothetical protein
VEELQKLIGEQAWRSVFKTAVEEPAALPPVAVTDTRRILEKLNQRSTRRLREVALAGGGGHRQVRAYALVWGDFSTV